MAPSSKPVALVVGASRGIGRQVAVDFAAHGYAGMSHPAHHHHHHHHTLELNIVVAAKTVSDPSKPITSIPDPKSNESTITTVSYEIRQACGEAHPIQVDVRSEESVNSLIAQTIAKYGRLDVLIYNSGAIYWASVQDTPLKRFKLMQSVNPEGLYATIQAALPHLTQAPSSSGGRILVVSPPIYSRFFRGKTAYAMGKVGMSVLTKGLAMDFVRQGLVARGTAITSLWPAVAIESAATERVTRLDPAEARDLRKPTIFSDAMLAIVRAPAEDVNGELLLDEDFLHDYCGVRDFRKYNVVPDSEPRRIMPARLPDLRVAEQDDEGKRVDSTKLAKL
ncbi:short chain dehydrogenase [Beauveria bassiana ARSEF 2860]|uniref:Short chain dehydrogenase n=1 Tax=Beauveria bassiana (strain ARSEF 2860) TaxID=655819 RepID=J4UL53_BEAB2|nr:short chain dehydrogenase [Beauveria bassiana ARSEF 2860]EJP65177.1 short chain dehydrogenase [Beauveria bassiana ARSEF 2860]